MGVARQSCNGRNFWPPAAREQLPGFAVFCNPDADTL